MRGSHRAPVAYVAVLAAALGCSSGGAGSEAPFDPAAAVARSLQGEWNGPCLATGAGAWRLHQYTFAGEELRFSTWDFESSGCAGNGLLVDRGFGKFAIGSSLTAALVEDEVLEVAAWQLAVTWTTGAVSRTAVAITDPRDPQPFLLFAAWDAEVGSSTLGSMSYRKAGQPPFDLGAAIVGTWARCVSATRADLRGFGDAITDGEYNEGWFTFEGGCLGRLARTDTTYGDWRLGSSIVARLDAAMVTGRVVEHRITPDDPWRTQTAFIATTSDGDALYLSELSSNLAAPVSTISSASGAWRRVNYALPPEPPPPPPDAAGARPGDGIPGAP